jgi:phospholipase C
MRKAESLSGDYDGVVPPPAVITSIDHSATAKRRFLRLGSIHWHLPIESSSLGSLASSFVNDRKPSFLLAHTRMSQIMLVPTLHFWEEAITGIYGHVFNHGKGNPQLNVRSITRISALYRSVTSHHSSLITTAPGFAVPPTLRLLSYVSPCYVLKPTPQIYHVFRACLLLL